MSQNTAPSTAETPSGALAHQNADDVSVMSAFFHAT